MTSVRLLDKNINRKMFWKSGLVEAIKDTENIIDTSDDNSLVVIKDKYPKATFHYLLLPTSVQLNSAKELTTFHIPLLQKMSSKAQDVTKQLHPQTEFMIGFHARPSMNHLHLHIISKDFLSPFLKTKKHWNSFNTEHFLKLSDIIQELQNLGKLNGYPSDEEIEILLKKTLKCNQCSFEAKTMPMLKTHLTQHEVQ